MNKQQLIERVTELSVEAGIDAPDVSEFGYKDLKEVVKSLEASVPGVPDIAVAPPETKPVVEAPPVAVAPSAPPAPPVPAPATTSHTHKLAPGVSMSTMSRGVLTGEAGLSVGDFSGGAEALAAQVEAGKVVAL